MSTDASMDAEKMIQEYALRWPIEPMFNDLKNAWGMAKAWQQSRQVLPWVFDHKKMIRYFQPNY